MKFKNLSRCVCPLGSCLATSALEAGVLTQSAEFAARLVGKRAGPEVTESLGSRAMRNSEQAVGSMSGRTLVTGRAVQETLERHGQRAEILARAGKGSRRVISHPRALAIWQAHGDQVVQALIRHGPFAEPVIESFGPPAVRALHAASPQNGRRIAMMLRDGSLARMGRTGDLLQVVGKYGDRVMDFVWRNKAALAVTTVLAAFLADPKPFLDGTRDLAGHVASAAIRPVAEVPGKIAQEFISPMNGTIAVILAAALGFILKSWLSKSRAAGS